MNDKTQQQQQQNTTNKCGDNVCENQIDRITTRNSIDTEINNPFVNNKNDNKNLNCFKCLKKEKNKNKLCSNCSSGLITRSGNSNPKLNTMCQNCINEGAKKKLSLIDNNTKMNVNYVKKKDGNKFCTRLFALLQQLSCHDNRNRDNNGDNNNNNEKKKYLNVSSGKK